MKLLKLSFSLFILVLLFSCNSLERNTDDVVEGTPTNSDTVLHQNSHEATHLHDSTATNASNKETEVLGR